MTRTSMWSTVRIGALAAALSLACTPPAYADAADYIQIRAAAMIDNGCGAFKYTERTIVDLLASDELSEEAHYQRWKDESIEDDVYDLWLAGLEAEATTLANSVGCTQNANQVINPVRGAVAAQLYQDLLLAVHFSQQSLDTFERIDLSPAELAAANAFDGHIQRLYGQDFAAFSAAQKDLIGRTVPPSVITDANSSFFALLSPEDQESRRQVIDPLQARARSTIGNALLDVSAESNGYVVRPAGNRAIELLSPQSPSQHLLIMNDSHRFSTNVNLGPWVNGVLIRMPDRTLRLMTYGNLDAFPELHAVLLIGRGPSVNAGGTAVTLYDDQWRATALSYAGVPVTGGCLGETCLSFPAEAHDAMLAVDRLDYVELWVSATDETTPPEADTKYRNTIFAATLQDFLNGPPK